MRMVSWAVVIALLSLPCATLVAAAPPNFVVIFIDDLGYGVRVGVPGVYFPAGREGLNPAEHTIAERLEPLGYATACVGKWHLGDQPDFLPTNQGFDRYFGIPYSNDMQRVSTATGESVVPLLRNAQVEALLTDDQQRQIVERCTEEAISFIRDSKDRPFFLYLPHTAVHLPLRPGERFVGRSGNGPFGDWVEEMDWGVGRILDTLRELGLDEKTLVVFTSDNGPWTGPVGEATSAGPLRGSKGSTWEGGVESASHEKPRLYDLDGDIGETTDVAAAHPDVVRQLRTLLQSAAEDFAATARPAGKVADPQMLYPAVSPDKSLKRSRNRESSQATPTLAPAG